MQTSLTPEGAGYSGPAPKEMPFNSNCLNRRQSLRAAHRSPKRLVSNFIAEGKLLIQNRFRAEPLRRMRAV